MNELKLRLGLAAEATWTEVQEAFITRLFELQAEQAEVARLFQLARVEQSSQPTQPSSPQHSDGCPWAPEELRRRFDAATTVAQRKGSRPLCQSLRPEGGRRYMHMRLF
ncbi:unnamed protein product [Bursaphelenchus okinawaensis]|uniref:Uncharacterized protein n=1 Tax=Bursaphelenchus okinawaensis TaxID=465554 RepID=A0A811KHJ5_9BILA|nr:unnamed protein product [Bursaphelenchus okinawaensis]CAG9103034.1 unnamed protein product [Bursaphelenchus okinawaensis]